MTRLVECVANFSEGRNAETIEALAWVVANSPGCQVLHLTSDPDHHRSVLTFAGPLEAVGEAGFHLARHARESIDLRQHTGIHPRIGALDVLPFVPLGDTTMQACRDLAHDVGRRIWEELQIPVYFYEEAALEPGRKGLEYVRRGGFEKPALAPDLGGPALHESAGAVIIGARPFLIAFNINLASDNLELAKTIARTIRASNGGLPGVKALGLPLTSRNQAQVSINLTDFERTPVHVVFETVRGLAAQANVAVAETELIGMLPQKAVETTMQALLKMPDFTGSRVVENCIVSSKVFC